MDFLDQQNKLSRILGDQNTSSEDMWLLADRKFEINRGEVAFARKSKSLLAYATGTVSGQAITLPAGFFEIHQLVVNETNMTGLREMPLQNYERLINSGDDSYHFWGNASGVRQLKFIDSVSNGQSFKFWYFKIPTVALDDDSDQSPFQDEYREASVFYAASELLPQAGKFQIAEYYRGRFNDICEEARIKTEGLFLNVIRAIPQVEDQYDYDKDVEGHHNAEMR